MKFTKIFTLKIKKANDNIQLLTNNCFCANMKKKKAKTDEISEIFHQFLLYVTKKSWKFVQNDIF